MQRKNPVKKINPSTTEALPSELLLYVFSFLNTQERVNASEVCQRWHAHAKDKSFTPLDLYTRFISLLGIYLCKKKNIEFLPKLCANSDFIGNTSHPFTIGLAGNDKLRTRLLCLADGPKDMIKNTYTEIKSLKLGEDSICLQNIPSNFKDSLTPTLLNRSNVILWCLPTFDINDEFDKQLMDELDNIKTEIGTNCKTPLLVVNTNDFNIPHFLSLSLQAEDTMETFYQRIRLQLKNMETSLQKFIKPEKPAPSRCILS